MTTILAEKSVTYWIQAVRIGDEDSARLLWNRYFDSLMRIARSRMGTLPRSTYDEEDAAISTFRILYKRLQEGGYPQLSDRDELWQLMMTVIMRKIGRRAEYESAEKRGSLNSHFTRVNENFIPCQDSADVELEYGLLLTKLNDPNLEHVAVLKLEDYECFGTRQTNHFRTAAAIELKECDRRLKGSHFRRFSGSQLRWLVG